MKIYTGRRDHRGNCVVHVVDEGVSRRLKARRDLFNHSPTGFEWGYSGSGPAQLALAILAEYLDDDTLALELHQKFKRAVIAYLPRNRPWTITDETVRNCIEGLSISAALEEE